MLLPENPPFSILEVLLTALVQLKSCQTKIWGVFFLICLEGYLVPL